MPARFLSCHVRLNVAGSLMPCVDDQCGRQAQFLASGAWWQPSVPVPSGRQRPYARTHAVRGKMSAEMNMKYTVQGRTKMAA